MDMTCPKCKKGEMKLPLAITPLQPGELEQRMATKEGTKLICTQCGHKAHPHELR
jgi:hypothetical protein